MLAALLDIVVPVFAVVALGALYGHRRPGGELGFVNRANIELFTPALVFSALVKYPLALGEHMALLLAGALVILLPGLLLALCPIGGLSRPARMVPAMFRNTGNLGIPLMVLAFGEQQLGAIVILFVLSNLLHFSVGIALLSGGREGSRWLWLRSPMLWAAAAGLLVANLGISLPAFVVTTASLLGQISVPLMLFALGIRLLDGGWDDLGLAIRVNLLYLAAGGVSLLLVWWLLPLNPEWVPLLLVSVALPPAVLNYMLCEQYQCQPQKVASIVLGGNALSLLIIPLAVWLALHLG
ncbi:AEC family transporter [Aeromonas simiae]|uniref:AEC family transporter n=1 Tax=Aeromonas simiae TaxID=218936 RepID=UPI00266DC890|nr:AEC family transporter [Aeromonas simiae]MDO2949327.1 AEC family transporter [Aeromonas simiae]MDO2952791.1 AEC family transporter [Aeromonas simiae]MDO2956550.1 AEC family transporter [Aeromonas simiae]